MAAGTSGRAGLHHVFFCSMEISSDSGSSGIEGDCRISGAALRKPLKVLAQGTNLQKQLQVE